MSSPTVVAAGCLVTRGTADNTEVLLVHRPKYDDWSLPKGKQEGDEHVIETAVREVQEESGLLVALRQPLPSRHYKVEGQPKDVHYWRAVVRLDKGFTPTQEVDEIRWLPLAEAARTVSHPKDASLVRSASDEVGTPFILLRHGHATKRSAWSGEDIERPLNRDGMLQSDRLAPRLAAYGVERVHTSAARRCRQTMIPYAQDAGLAATIEPELTEQAYQVAPDQARARVRELLADAVHSGEATVLCGHRPYLPELVDYLIEGTRLSRPQDTVPTASMLVLSATSEGITALEHHLPT